jgi:glycerol dehydrogenase-like iron-containing ADH family enzyme
LNFDGFDFDDNIKQTFNTLDIQGRVPHAVVIESRDNEKAMNLAVFLSMYAVCTEPVKPCGHCEQCHKAKNKAHADIKYVELPNDRKQNSYEYEQVVLAIIVSTAVASIYLTAEHTVHYNSGLAHAIFYSLTAHPHIEKNHLHGEVVSYGVLNLLLVDNNMEDFETVYKFNKSVGLPTCLKDLEFTKDNIEQLAENAVIMKDIEHNPYVITKEMLITSMEKLEELNK